MGTMACLSGSRTPMKTAPSLRRPLEAAIWDFRKASAKLRPRPITSPVDCISGPSVRSAPGKRAKGNTVSLTAKGTSGLRRSCSGSSCRPIISHSACLASGVPMALLTKGTVREARGLTSSR